MQSLKMKHNLPLIADPGSPCSGANTAAMFLYIFPEL